MGETNLAPARKSTSQKKQLVTSLESGTVEVAEDDDGNRFFEAALDLSEYDAGIEYTLSASHDDLNRDLSASATGTLAEGKAPEADIDVSGDAPSSVEVDGNATLEVTITNNGDSAATVDYEALIGGEDVSEGRTRTRRR